jgi:hypothetical protein
VVTFRILTFSFELHLAYRILSKKLLVKYPCIHSYSHIYNGNIQLAIEYAGELIELMNRHSTQQALIPEHH